MYKYILQEAGDINWMAIFALITFFCLFIVIVVATFGSSKAYIKKMASLPLDDSYSSEPAKE